MTATKYLGQGRDMGGAVQTNNGSPSGATDTATKGYVDNLVGGLEWKQEVAAASTANGTLATAFANSQTLDGVTLATGMRILVKNQTTQSENGIYTVNATGAPTRATDADSSAELTNATVYIAGGTTQGPSGTVPGQSFTQATKAPVIGTDAIVFVQNSAGVTYSAGTGLTLTGTVFSLPAAVAGAGLSYSSGVVAVTNTDGSVTVGADTVSVAVASGGHITVSGGAGIKLDATVSIIFNQATNANSTSVAVTHNLGVQFLSGVALYITSTGEKVECDVVATSTTVMTFTFNTAPTLNTLTFALSI